MKNLQTPVSFLTLFAAMTGFGQFQAELLMYNDSAKHSPLQITGGSTAGVRFNVERPFTAVKLCCPSYNNDLGSLTLTLYRWAESTGKTRQGAKLSEKRFADFRDNAKLALTFEPLPPGTYYAELSAPEESVGVWKTSGAATADTASFFNNRILCA